MSERWEYRRLIEELRALGDSLRNGDAVATHAPLVQAPDVIEELLRLYDQASDRGILLQNEVERLRRPLSAEERRHFNYVRVWTARMEDGAPIKPALQSLLRLAEGTPGLDVEA